MSNEKSLSSFTSKLASDIRDSIKGDVKRIAEEALRKAINETVYLKQKTYKPTYNLLNAVEVTDLDIGKTTATFSVIVNGSKLNPDSRKPWNWNAHSGMSGQPFQDGLVETLDQGIKSPIYTHPAYGFIDKAYDDLEDSLILAMAKALRAKGYKVTMN